MITHQQNALRLDSLRRTTDSLDEQIKNTIRRIADLRKEIQSIPEADTGEGSTRREVKVDELLSYAKYIAKTTVPPTMRKHAALPGEENKKDEGTVVSGNGGIATPPQQQETDDNTARGVKELAEHERAFIIPQNLTFDPWPSDVHMKNGALGEIQAMVEAGRDPASVLSPAEKAEAERKRKQEAEEEEEKRKRVQAEWGYGGGGGGGRRGTVMEPFNPDDL